MATNTYFLNETASTLWNRPHRIGRQPLALVVEPRQLDRCEYAGTPPHGAAEANDLFVRLGTTRCRSSHKNAGKAAGSPGLSRVIFFIVLRSRRLAPGTRQLLQ